MARRRLAERIASGTAEIVLGDAAELPWADGRFSVVSSINTLKFVPDSEAALREIYRVLRPGGRAVLTMGEAEQPPAGSPESYVNDLGERQWSDAAAQRLMEGVGFVGVVVSVLPVFSKAKLVRGTKPTPAPSAVDDAHEATEPLEEVVPWTQCR
jgi:ubiquinone/menaquinone biosynthesis C-methylase UbiE